MICGLARSLSYLTLLLGSGTALADVSVVNEGKATAVVVLAERPTRVARYAAEELVSHVAKATGVRLALVSEKAVRDQSLHPLFIGDCEAARAADLALAQLEPEASVLRVTDNAVFIAGDDGGGEPLDSDTRAGTLWGVYEWLDRDVQVRWLWPGDLGTYVPKTSTVIAKSRDETTEQRFFQRRLRAGLGFVSEHPALGFREKAFQQFSNEQSIYLRRHRMGRSYPVSYGHAFTDWWQKDGKAHPKWFQWNDKGTRGPTKKTARFSMCVSNADLQREVVARWKAKRPPDAKTPAFINALRE